jgi:hypothetical protein
MARLPDDQIDRLKQDISLLRLVERQGYTLKKEPVGPISDSVIGRMKRNRAQI